MLFLQVVVPVLAILAAGYAYGRWTATDLRPISHFTLVVLSPALVFGYLATTEIAPGEFARIAAYALLYVAAAAVLTWAAALALGQRALLSPLLLVSVFMNSGNYGLPLVLFAWGKTAFVLGVTTLAIHLILMYAAGTWFASLHRTPDWRKGLRMALGSPPVLAGVAAALWRLAGLPVPEALLRPVRLLGDASVPVILLLLGMQLARTRVEGSLAPIALGTALRLGLGTVVAVALAWAIGLSGLTAKVLVLQHAMPSAAIVTLLAVEYDARPDLVASVTVVTTAISVVTVTALLYFLEWAY